MHGPKGSRRKQSDYAVALGEKQKLRYQYGLLEKQFRRIFQTALRRRGVTGETLLQLLETRLDNVVFRLGLANTRSARAPARVARARAGERPRREHRVLQREGGRRVIDQGQAEVASARVAQSRAHADRAGAGLARGRSRRAERQSRAHSGARRNAADGQRAVDRRALLALSAAQLLEILERFGVAAPLQRMAQLRIELTAETLLESSRSFAKHPSAAPCGARDRAGSPRRAIIVSRSRNASASSPRLVRPSEKLETR